MADKDALVMSTKELTARLIALSEHRHTEKLSVDPDNIWRQVCREAAARLRASEEQKAEGQVTPEQQPAKSLGVVTAPSAPVSEKPSEAPTPALPPLTETEKHDAFEWLRHTALVAGENNGAHHAYVALRAWAELKAAQSARAALTLAAEGVLHKAVLQSDTRGTYYAVLRDDIERLRDAIRAALDGRAK